MLHEHNAKEFGVKKVWQVGTQNMFGGAKIGRLSINTEGNRDKTEKLADKTWINLSNLPSY